MYDLGCMLLELRPFVVLDGLPGLYGLKYDSTTAYGLLLYLCSYKLDGFATKGHVDAATRGVFLSLPINHATALIEKMVTNQS